MVLRQAELKDEKNIVEITNLLFLKIPHFVWNDEKFVTGQIMKGEYFLGEEERRVVGIMSLRQRRDRMHIETLAVREEFQSKGLGTKFIEFAKQFTRDKGFNTLHAYSFIEYNIANFYLSKGFTMLDYSGYYSNHKYHCFELKV